MSYFRLFYAVSALVCLTDCSDVALGSLVKTLTACLSDIIPFMAVLTLATVAFGLTFHLQMADSTADKSVALPESLWNSMLMAVLGDNAAGVDHSSGPSLVLCFFLLTLIVNVIMMNVLIVSTHAICCCLPTAGLF